MKIGIITLFGDNYGNKLQNFAVQRIIEGLECEVETIITNTNRGIVKPRNTKTEFKKFSPFYIGKVLNIRFKNKYLYKNSRDGIVASIKFVKNVDYKALVDARTNSFDEFTNKNISLSNNILTLEDVFNTDEYDFFVAGSDQVWNPTYPHVSRLNFLTFAPREKRIALSPSIGLSSLPEHVKPLYTEWLNGINALSVREEQGAKIIKELTGRDVPVLADPTLCVSKEEWIEIEEKPDFDCSEPYVFTYFLGNETNKYRKFIDGYAKKNNYKVINIFDLREPEHYVVNPAHFVYLIHNAKMVFTDSFHGSVFSLIMHIPFVVFNRVENGGQGMSSRIDTLLKTFSMESRHFERLKNIDDIDFNNVDSTIETLQQKTDSFLKSAFESLKGVESESEKDDFVEFLDKKSDCCGCHACSNVCPKNCISMDIDSEGFWYPNIDKNLCINCNMCQKVCPAVNTNITDNEPVSYLGYNKNQDVRKQSSSGGMFTPIAESIINNGGAVFGAAFNDKYEVEHIMVNDIDGLSKLRGSKYVQSKIGDTYQQAKEILESGKKILFTGTPCQIEGLKLYLRKDYENLYTQDIICHGVPSPNVWNEYIKYVSNDNDVMDVSFRDKKYGWHYFSMKIEMNKKKYIKRLDEDLFLRLFLDNTILRPSCYACKYKKEIRISDFTLADCWRPAKVKSQLKDDDKGLSMIFVNSPKGQSLFSKVEDKLVVQEIDYDLAINSQDAATNSVKPNVHRPDFFVEFNNKDFNYIDKNWYGNDFVSNIKKAIIYKKTKIISMIKR